MYMLLLNTRSTSSILHRGDGHLGEDGLERANVVELDVRRGAEMREVRQAGLSISDQNSTISVPFFFLVRVYSKRDQCLAKDII